MPAAPETTMSAGPTIDVEVGSLKPDGTPVWDAISFDVLCSRCGYNLRTLTRPKCTECGLDFDWRAVLDNATRRSEFLFEHHWLRRPLRSWGATVWQSLWPRRFWANVSLHEDIKLIPLFASIVLSMTTLFVALHGSAWIMSRAIYLVAPVRRMRPMSISVVRRRFLDVAYRLGEFALLPYTEGGSYLLWMGVAVALPLAGAVGLLIALRQTMRRYRVRFVQVLRVVAYTATPVCLWCAAAYLATYYVLPSLFRFTHFRTVLKFSFAVFAWGVFSWYLWRGFKHYLHLPHAAILGMTAALVGLLMLATANLVVAAIEEGILG
ncbi:MAG TPA: hypothetical protein VJZ71_10730 [Phycisphaerae bacterium]|nr:hypothetical protein [Phycisphaerae bacterium]